MENNTKKTRKDMNNCIFQVNLAKDCRFIAATKEDGSDAIVYFTGANNAGYRDRNDNNVVSFIEFQIRGKMATNLQQYLTKGTGLLVRGELRTWSKKNEDGSYANNYCVEVKELSFLPRTNGNGQNAQGAQSTPPAQPEQEATPVKAAQQAPAAKAPTAPSPEQVQTAPMEETFTIDDDDPFSL